MSNERKFTVKGRNIAENLPKNFLEKKNIFLSRNFFSSKRKTVYTRHSFYTFENDFNNESGRRYN